MTRRRIENLILALVVIALVCVGGIHSALHAMQITQPSVNTIQGSSICSDTPSAPALLYFGGTNWCGTANPSISVIKSDGGSIGQGGFDAMVGSAGEWAFSGAVDGDSDAREVIAPGTGLQIGTGTATPTTVIDENTNGFFLSVDTSQVQWDSGADFNESYAPRSTWSSFATGVFTASSSLVYGQYTPSASIRIQSINLSLATAPAGCSTYAVVGVSDNGSFVDTPTVTLASGTGSYHTGSIGYIVPSGDTLAFEVKTAEVGCSTTAQNANFVVEYTTN